MKNIFLKLVLILVFITGFIFNVYAQKLYGTSGDAFSTYDITSNSITQLALLSSVNIYGAKGRLVHIGNGQFIGITENSPSMYGAIYKTDTTTNTVSLLYEFTNNNKAQGSLVLANNGKLYCLGNTGTNNESRIYSFDLSTNTYTNEYEINGNAKTWDLGGMVNASNGLLYGVTQRGGNDDKGMLFSFNTGNSDFTKLYDFNTSNGSEPVASMIQATNGNLYGVTSYGGSNDHGVIFSFDISTNTYTKLFDFVQSTGESPSSPLYQASDGKLYGVTMTGGSSFQGVLYSFDINSNTYTVLHNFFANDGYGPRAYPIEGASGVLYGTTGQGGVNFAGSIYKYDLSTSTWSKLLDGNSTLGNFSSPFFSFSSFSTGLSNINHSIQNLNLFPNPCSDYLQFELSGLEYNYQILNSLGQIIESGSINNNYISTHSLINGIYFLQITDRKFDNRYFGRFVKE